MRFCFAIAIATVFSVFGAVAEPLKFPPGAFGDRFNETSMRLGLKARLALRTCPAGGYTCTYQTSTGLYCFAFSDTGPSIDSVQCILASKGDDGFLDMIELFAILPSMFQPPASQTERTVAMETVLKRFNDSEEHNGETLLHDVTYSLSLRRGIGLFLTAKAASN